MHAHSSNSTRSGSGQRRQGAFLGQRREARGLAQHLCEPWPLATQVDRMGPSGVWGSRHGDQVEGRVGSLPVRETGGLVCVGW